MASLTSLAVMILVVFNFGVRGQVGPSRYCDSVTGICFSAYTTSEGITYGVALPAVNETPTDAILHIVAPVQNGWVGVAWGGHMAYNPLTVAWPDADTVVVSSRMAFALNVPQPYAGAVYTYLRGTTVNETHWAVTVLCRGCSTWAAGGTAGSINPNGTSPFAWAQAAAPVLDPSSNTSAFQAHDSFGYWTHDLALARSSEFDRWVSDNAQTPDPTSSPASTTTPNGSAAPSPTTTSPSPASTGTPNGTLPASCPGVSAPRTPFLLAQGWTAVKVAGGLTLPRDVVLDSEGRLIIVQNGVGISQHIVDASGCVQSSRVLISRTDLNHGLYLSPDGKTLYASSASTVWSWPYDPVTGDVQNTTSPSLLVSGMYVGGHITRTLIVPPHRPDLLLVSHGSNANFDYASGNPATARAIVKVFNLTALPEGGYNYVSDGYNAGYGLRNEVGLAFDGNNMLWGVENGGDQMARTANGTTTDVHTNNPGDKLNYLGDVTVPNKDWYGYPTCSAVWDPSAFSDRVFSIGEQFVPVPNSTFNDTSCAERAVPPRLTFQAHSAPLDAKFDAGYANLYVTFHGSWNRQPPTGYKLVVVPFARASDGSYAPVAPANSGNGYQDVFYHRDVTQCSATMCARPVGLVFDGKGRLYMTSDAAAEGELFLLERI